MLALVVGGGDGLDDPERPLAARPRVLLIIEGVMALILLLPKEVVLLIGIKVPRGLGDEEEE